MEQEDKKKNQEGYTDILNRTINHLEIKNHKTENVGYFTNKLTLL